MVLVKCFSIAALISFLFPSHHIQCRKGFLSICILMSLQRDPNDVMKPIRGTFHLLLNKILAVFRKHISLHDISP